MSTHSKWRQQEVNAYEPCSDCGEEICICGLSRPDRLSVLRTRTREKVAAASGEYDKSKAFKDGKIAEERQAIIDAQPRFCLLSDARGVYFYLCPLERREEGLAFFDADTPGPMPDFVTRLPALRALTFANPHDEWI